MRWCGSRSRRKPPFGEYARVLIGLPQLGHQERADNEPLGESSLILERERAEVVYTHNRPTSRTRMYGVS
jgi:hypothetical protein